MSKPKKFFIVLAVLVVLLLAAATVFVHTFDANRYRSVILTQLSRSVNRPVQAADLELRLLPLRLRLNQVRILEDPSFAGEDFIRAEAVQFDFSLWALLQGQTQVEALELVQPTANLRQNAAGEWNFSTLAASPEEDADEEPAAAPAAGPATAPVRNWLLREGTVVIERPNQPTLRLTGVELGVKNLSTTEAFPFRVAVNFSSDSRVTASGRLGPLRLAALERTPIQADVTLENFRPAALAFLRTVPPELARLRALAGALNLRSGPDDIGLKGNLAVELEGFPHPLKVEALDLKLEPNRLVVAPFNISPQSGLNLTVGGTVDDYRGQAQVKARVTAGEVPLEPLLALATTFGKNPLGKGQKLSGRVRPAINLRGPLAEPARLSYEGTLDFRNLSLTTPELPEPVSIDAVELALSPTQLSAQPFTAQIGEKLRARINFRLDNYRTRPALQGHLETEGADLEALLGLVRALGKDPLPGGKARGQVSASVDVRGPLGEKAPALDLSGRARLAGAWLQPAELTEPLTIERVEVQFGPDRLQVSDLHLTTAGAKVQGSMRVDNFDAPRVSFDLRGDKLDVEALQAIFGGQAAVPVAPRKRRRRLSELFLPVVHAQEKKNDWFARLSGRGRLHFDQVKHGTMILAPFASPVAIANQVLTCDPMEFGLYGGGGRGRLVVDLRAAEPVVKFDGLLRNVDADKLLSANSDSKGRLHGRLGGTIEVRFVGNERERIFDSAKGQGQLSLVNGRLAQLNLNRELGMVGKLTGLRLNQRDTPIEDMTTKFDIADGWVRTDDLRLSTPDLTMTAVGGFSLQAELAFESTATFSPEASQRMAGRSPLGALAGNFFTDDQGRVVIPLQIRGTFSDPKFTPDLGRLARMKLGKGRSKPGGTVGDILDRLLKRKPRR